MSNPIVEDGYSNNEKITENKNSFFIGAGVEYYLTNNISINTGAEYFTSGVENAGNNFKEIEITQVRIPLSLKGYVLKGLFIEAGPYVSLINNVTTKTYNGESNPDYVKNENLDMGVLLGIGYSLEHFYFYTNYNLSFVDILKYDTSFSPSFDPTIDRATTAPEFKNNYIQIGIGYRY